MTEAAAALICPKESAEVVLGCFTWRFLWEYSEVTPRTHWSSRGCAEGHLAWERHGMLQMQPAATGIG